jgi:hypothetical protein
MTCEADSTTIFLDQGEYFNAIFPVMITPPETGVAVPLDLTGYAVEFQSATSGGTLVVTLAIGSGVTPLDQTTNTGQVRIEMVTATTSAVAAGTYPYDCYAISPSGQRRKFRQGKLVIQVPNANTP